MYLQLLLFFFFFFNDPAPTEIYPLPLHDALPIYARPCTIQHGYNEIGSPRLACCLCSRDSRSALALHHSPAASNLEIARSEEHTSELQSQSNLVCRLLLEKKKRTVTRQTGLRLHV